MDQIQIEKDKFMLLLHRANEIQTKSEEYNKLFLKKGKIVKFTEKIWGGVTLIGCVITIFLYDSNEFGFDESQSVFKNIRVFPVSIAIISLCLVFFQRKKSGSYSDLSRQFDDKVFQIKKSKWITLTINSTKFSNHI